MGFGNVNIALSLAEASLKQQGNHQSHAAAAAKLADGHSRSAGQRQGMGPDRQFNGL